jgi:hypothetical protein
VAEIKRRNLIRDQYLTQVFTGVVIPGMTEIEAYCTWGNAERIEKTPAGTTLGFLPKYGPKVERTLTVVDGIVSAAN